MNNIDVVYTMWANLKKTQGMDVGQVGFFKDKEVTVHNLIIYLMLGPWTLINLMIDAVLFSDVNWFYAHDL